MAQQQTPQQPALQIPEGLVQSYANSLNVLFTPWDFMLLFGSTRLPQAIGIGAGQAIGTVEVDVAITMSPQHAKAAVAALQQVVEEYERQFGEIHVPDTGAKQ
jgi:DNA-binding LytR/AlgR family response regulator